MVKENGAPTAAEKGKGKIDDSKSSDTGKKPDETKKDKDGKALVNGKKGEETKDGMRFMATFTGWVGLTNCRRIE